MKPIEIKIVAMTQEGESTDYPDETIIYNASHTVRTVTDFEELEHQLWAVVADELMSHGIK